MASRHTTRTYTGVLSTQLGVYRAATQASATGASRIADSTSGPLFPGRAHPKDTLLRAENGTRSVGFIKCNSLSSQSSSAFLLPAPGC